MCDDTVILHRFITEAVGFAGSFTKRRIVMIANKKKTSVVFTALALIAVMLVGSISMPAAAKTANSQKSGWIYFVREKDSQLYRSHPDGSGKAPVSNVKTNDYAISGNWIYYNPIGIGIYKIKKDGTGNTKVSNLVCAIVGISENKIFISYAKGGGGSGSDNVYSITLDGKNLKKISKNIVYDAQGIVSKGYVYFTDEACLYRVRTDGIGEKMIVDSGKSGGDVYPFANDGYTIAGNLIYCSVFHNDDTKGTIYRMNLDGTGKTPLGIKDAYSVACVDGIFYYKTNAGKTYKFNTDGTGRTAVKPSSWAVIRAFGSKTYGNFKE